MVIQPCYPNWRSIKCKSLVRKTSISKRDTLRRTVTVHEDTKTPKEDEMKALSDFLRVQIGYVFEWVLGALRQRKTNRSLQPTMTSYPLPVRIAITKAVYILLFQAVSTSAP